MPLVWMDIDDACQCWLCLCNYVRLRLSDKPSASTKGLQSSVAKVNGLLRIGVRLDDNQVPTPKAYNFLFLMIYSAKQRSTTASAHDPRSNDLDPRSNDLLCEATIARKSSSPTFFCIHGYFSTVLHRRLLHPRLLVDGHPLPFSPRPPLASYHAPQRIGRFSRDEQVPLHLGDAYSLVCLPHHLLRLGLLHRGLHGWWQSDLRDADA